MTDAIQTLLSRWRDDPVGTYRSWFLWAERLKNFRSIRRGIGQVVREIQADTFGNQYKGSSLETVVGSIAEQRQIFKGADHAFLWKPKLRIPDIYENRGNQLAFGELLDRCACCDTEAEILAAIHRVDRCGIKGLGPAAANILYFLHPTLMPPFNTAIVKGYNTLTGARVKLGRWHDYLAMRAGIFDLNKRYRSLLSNDLGAIAGLLFDIGQDRYAPPPREDDVAARQRWEADLALVREASAKSQRALAAAREEDRSHTEIQGWLRDLGRALGYDVWVAANDRNRVYGSGLLSAGCLDGLPEALDGVAGADAVRLIDVLWLERGASQVACAFEVEHTTSIYSGIVRLLDLALSSGLTTQGGLYLVAPDDREEEVRAQLRRPAFRLVADLRVSFIPYSELASHRDAMARFGNGIKAIQAVARILA